MNGIVARRISAGLAATLALAVVPAAVAAPGDTQLEGTTTEGVKVKLTVGEFGNATAFRIGKSKVECGHGDLSNRAGTYKPLDTSDPGEFTDRTKSSSDSEDGRYHFQTKSTIQGAAVDGDDFSTWSGTFKLVTKVFEDGEQIDDCKLKTDWTVSS
jgi:hypothetical protein